MRLRPAAGATRENAVESADCKQAASLSTIARDRGDMIYAGVTDAVGEPVAAVAAVAASRAW